MRWSKVAALLVMGCATHGAAPVLAGALPGNEVLSLDGQAATLKTALAGSVAVVDLWATWCGACERERPKLERLQAAYGAQGLRVVGLNVGEAPSVVTAYLAKTSIGYAVYLDPDFQLADALGDKRLPTILLVDRHGRIRHRASTLDQGTLDQLKSLLAGGSEE